MNADLEKDEIVISHSNIAKITIRYYQIDLEILFSRNPFINQVLFIFNFRFLVKSTYKQLQKKRVMKISLTCKLIIKKQLIRIILMKLKKLKLKYPNSLKK